MPPSGKTPVSTAALRTTSTTLPISTRASRLAEYSMVKCGIYCSPWNRTDLDRNLAVTLRQRKRSPSPFGRGSSDLPDLMPRLFRQMQPLGGKPYLILSECHEAKSFAEGKPSSREMTHILRRWRSNGIGSSNLCAALHRISVSSP